MISASTDAATARTALVRLRPRLFLRRPPVAPRRFPPRGRRGGFGVVLRWRGLARRLIVVLRVRV
ncbi:hypothetical protein [Streptomyces sp. NPDC048639]|uniref:hypothetical protein n=1 Tax=Streptomyces sp. NPDC048639 TaxID=3365581 RepID=UPI00371ACC0D